MSNCPTNVAFRQTSTLGAGEASLARRERSSGKPLHQTRSMLNFADNEQIWFQNRRQSSRRKSRPLLPYEIAQYHQMAHSTFASQESAHYSFTSQPAGNSTPPDSSQDSVSRMSGIVDPQISMDHSPDQPRMQQGPDVHIQTAAPLPGSQESFTSTGYLANRRSANMPGSDGTSSDGSGEELATVTGRPSQKAPSFVRLAMTAEGKAEVVTKNAASPSPPRPVQSPQIGDTPILGAIPFKMTPSSSTRTLHRSSSGRSRDSRSWEFWCDKDARAELEVAAEKNSSGSAAGAIGLLRSASGRNILGSMPLKRNSGILGPSAITKRTKLDSSKRPPLQRSRTSLGRLQSGTSEGVTAYAKPMSKPKHSISTYMPGDDSNKENVSPEWRGRGDRRSDLHSDAESTSPGPDATLLHDDLVVDASLQFRSSQAPTMRSNLSSRDRSDGEYKQPFESDAARSSSQRRAGPSAEADLDCIQGLLSLSQGNWR
jgi:hypothetical protein